MLVLPDKIKNLIGNESFSYDDVGMSDSTVIIFTDKVLKIQNK
jgi:kanamycin kinase/aminoglycoside 3'-phosphotransferase-3